MVHAPSIRRVSIRALSALGKAIVWMDGIDAAMALYSEVKPLASPSALYFEMLSDRTRRQSILIAELKAAQRRDVMLFDEDSTHATDAFRETRLFWDDVANGSM